MRTTLKKTAVSRFTIISLLVGSVLSSPLGAMPSRHTSTMGLLIHTQTRPVKSEKEAVLANNSAAKPEPALPAVMTKKTEDKKTISRCWKRLMNMAREIRHAHTTKKK